VIEMASALNNSLYSIIIPDFFQPNPCCHQTN
jgi:hypothetical protein